MPKVLIVTDYAGTLHITPIGNKAFYEGRNKIVKDKQFKFREMTEDEADAFVVKHKGTDPDKLSLPSANSTIEAQAAEIENLKKLLAEAQAKQAGTKPEGGEKPKADEVIAKIKEAKTKEEVDSLAAGDERKTVQDAAAAKIATFQNNSVG